MPVLRQQHTRNFTTFPNELLQDPRLSCGDLGLLVQMLSLPENWCFSTSSLNTLYAGRTGKESLAKSVKRLQELGYLAIERKRTPSGKLGAAVWTVCDTPQPGKPHSGFPPYKKNKIEKSEKAVPAVEGGQQPEIYYDTESGEWKRRGTA